MRPVVLMQFGSHVYGTNTPESDLDFKGVFVPSARDILLHGGKVVVGNDKYGRPMLGESVHENTNPDPAAKNVAGDVDRELHTLRKYVELLLQAQTVAIDMLFTPKSFWRPINEKVAVAWPWHSIRINKHHFLHKGVSSYVGYCRTQANKYGIKGSRMSAVRKVLALPQPALSLRVMDHVADLHELSKEEEFINLIEKPNNRGTVDRFVEVVGRKFPYELAFPDMCRRLSEIYDEYGHRARQAERNEGVDWKAVMHAVRVQQQAMELLRTGHVTMPRPNAQELLKIRTGQVPYKTVAGRIEDGMVELEEANASSQLPDEPNREFAENLVCQAYAEQVRSAFPSEG